jgi:hypothetical protein
MHKTNITTTCAERKENSLFGRFAVQVKALAGTRSNRHSSLVTFCDDRK